MHKPLASIALAIVAVGGSAAAADWRTASREPTGAAPNPAEVQEAVVQIYAAPVWGWRGRFAVHTWIAVKPAAAPAYTVYEIIGWRKYRGQSPLVIHSRAPDARWFGAAPEVLFDRRGPQAEGLIGRIDAAARAYPYANSYVMWPGPNSNTFTRHVLRAVPEIDAELPTTAIGKDYLGLMPVALAPGGGFQVSLFGVLGLLVSMRDGIEVNMLGFVFGFDPSPFALKLPALGRISLGSGERTMADRDGAEA